MIRALAAASAVLLVAGVVVLAASYPAVEAGDELGLIPGLDGILVPEWGETGSWVVRYEHLSEAGYTFTVRNRSPLPLSITEVGLPTESGHHMLQTVDVGLLPPGNDPEPAAAERAEPFSPFRLPPGGERTILITTRFDACEYYTERALEIHEAHPIEYRLLPGLRRQVEVTYPHPIVIRSPTIQNCPDREMDRASHRRSDP